MPTAWNVYKMAISILLYTTSSKPRKWTSGAWAQHGDRERQEVEKNNGQGEESTEVPISKWLATGTSLTISTTNKKLSFVRLGVSPSHWHDPWDRDNLNDTPFCMLLLHTPFCMLLLHAPWCTFGRIFRFGWHIKKNRGYINRRVV